MMKKDEHILGKSKVQDDIHVVLVFTGTGKFLL